MTTPESMARARAEFNPLLGKDGMSAVKSALTEKLSIDSCADLTFLGYVIQEALRRNPVAPVSSPLEYQKDTKLGNLHVKAGEPIFINIWGLHHNGNQWQRPFEFLPDRFDLAHPLSRTPSGAKRSTFAWLPFNGGKRVCFGKTFAEYVIKIMVTMMTQRFNMKFVDQKKYHSGNLPMIHSQISHFPELLIELSERKSL